MNAMVMICSTVLGGVLVQAGKDHGATGRLSAQRTAIMNVTSLLAGPIGGYLAGRAFGWTAGICAGFLFCLTPIIWFNLHEPRTAVRNPDVLRLTRSQLRTIVRSKTLWCAVGMNILLYIAPGFSTPLLYYQQNVLHMSDQFVGNLSVVSGGLGLIGALIYMRLCRTLPLRPLMYAGVIGAAVGSLLYLGYTSKLLAVVIEGGNSLLSVIGTLVLFDLSARAAPEGCEALAYSLMMAAANLTSSLSDVVGSWMYDKLHWPFMHLVWLNGGTTFLILIVVPFLPKVLMDRRDGEVGG
jgi:Na+/melibiose symporter-like transporter